MNNCISEGYLNGSSAVVFPHVIPDNCSDCAGLLLEEILSNKKVNKAKVDPAKGIFIREGMQKMANKN